MPYLYAYSFCAFLVCVLLVAAIKSLRGRRGALSKRLCLDDLLVLLVPALLIAITHIADNRAFSLLIAIGVGIYGLLVWLDAVLFVQYRIEINRQTLAWFFTGSKGIAKGLPHLLSFFRRYPSALLIPPVWFYSLSVLVVADYGAILLVPVLVSALAAVACSARLADSAVTSIVAALCAVTLITMADVNAAGLHTFAGGGLALLVSALLALAVYRQLLAPQHEFFTTPTLLINLLADDSFKPEAAFEPRDEHARHVDADYSAKPKSRYFGACQNANIILITMESLGCYIDPYMQSAAKSRLAERMRKHGWMSANHFSLCPNTTVATNQIYTGDYSNNPYNKSDSLFPGRAPRHVSHLQANGYKALFLDSADTNLYDYHKLLSRIGFDRYWGSDDIPANGRKADYRLWNMVDAIVDEVADSPFFLHIINDQTHMPYEVVDETKFNRHSGKTARAKYLNAVEEVDYILDEFLRRLGAKLDLSNTLLVFTGDHGESFGEYGYSFHSNSVIMPQIRVPFLMSHPRLESRAIAHSCHFDLFPTFFDLLGIEFDYPALGTPMGIDDREFAYFAHSATLKGNSPANFGFIRDGELLWMDRLFNQVNLLSHQQTRIAIDSREQAYAKSLLHKMLSSRGVIA
ncbi:LTA synthase family protein [Alteromonas sp. ASW11-19]|uniref:LTA synthase family protein n=1 Tax=Alteromonas salexigens TaxID=2982530 RepID=A0ABT2VNX9_9ALTE|nr:LTA synthase family protein [Alteromonas salexigens]MCU7554997.1 LTA synthase family protein [Alteromonas salexigens]